jgi:lipoprotein signal peptidase
MSESGSELFAINSRKKMVIIFLSLVLMDQFSKHCALSFLPAAEYLPKNSALSLAWHIHQPNALTPTLCVLAFAVVVLWWLLPIPNLVKVIFTAAGVSNHVEKLVRPGTVDFIVVQIGKKLWAANIADGYVFVGLVLLLIALIKRVSIANSWSETI